MFKGPDTTRLLDNESVEEEVAEAPPPPYHMISGLSSNSNQSFSGQSSVGNHRASVSTQPPPAMYYGYTQLQPATGQLTIPADISVLAAGQPIYIIPVTALQTNINQPSIMSRCETIQPQPTRMEPRNRMASSRNRALEPDSSNALHINYCCLFLVLAGTISFLVLFFLIVIAAGSTQRKW